jgi:hypothetical protein
MMLTGDGRELDAQAVAWSGGRAPAAEPCDRAVVGRKRALACRWGEPPCDQVACIEVGVTAQKADVNEERAA